MDVLVTGRHCQIPDDFRTRVTQLLSGVEKLRDRVIRVEVQVSANPHTRQPDQATTVEITLRSRGPVVRAEASADDKLVAFDHALDRLKSQLRRAADRRKVHRGLRASQQLGMSPPVVGPGRASLTMRVREDMVNGQGNCHGGVLATLADSAFAFACNTYDEVTVAAGFDIVFVAPSRLGDQLTATALERARFARSGLYECHKRLLNAVRVAAVGRCHIGDNSPRALFRGYLEKCHAQRWEQGNECRLALLCRLGGCVLDLAPGQVHRLPLQKARVF